jgi:5-dehydro-2-deoxygluconokinase
LLSIVEHCDLVVGTEEEMRVAGGEDDTLAALRRLRSTTSATLVLKRGPLGCVVFEQEIPGSLDGGIVGRGFRVDVFNVLGAGDAFMSGFLRGWLRGESLVRCCTLGNACGALVVSRHGCAPAIPSAVELEDFLARADEIDDVRRDPFLAHVHRATTQRRAVPALSVFALDNRLYLEEIAREAGAEPARLRRLKVLLAAGAVRAAEALGVGSAGVIIDDRWGEAALWQMTGRGLWVARAVERSGDIPLRFECGPNVGLELRTWPREHVVKCMARIHPDDHEALRVAQLSRLEQLYRACVATEHDLLLEILPPPERTIHAGELALLIEWIYARGIRPDWWKLEAQPDVAAWNQIAATIEAADPYCRGILVLGGGLPPARLAGAFEIAARCGACKGFAVGRTIFEAPSRAWLSGQLDDGRLVAETSERFAQVERLWQEAARR